MDKAIWSDMAVEGIAGRTVEYARGPHKVEHLQLLFQSELNKPGNLTTQNEGPTLSCDNS
jgi:hypothetical protein